MSSTQQQFVAIAGAGLVGLNWWLGDAHTTIKAGTSTGAAPADKTNAHRELKVIAAELLFVALATLAAGSSSRGIASAAVAVIVAIGILWSINHFSIGGKR